MAIVMAMVIVIAIAKVLVEEMQLGIAGVGFRSIGILRDLPVCKFGLCLRKQYLVVQILLTRPHKQYIVLQYFVYEFYLSILFVDFIYRFVGDQVFKRRST